MRMANKYYKLSIMTMKHMYGCIKAYGVWLQQNCLEKECMYKRTVMSNKNYSISKNDPGCYAPGMLPLK